MSLNRLEVTSIRNIKAASFDELDLLADCDWVIEVIAEKLEWKTDLYSKIELTN